MSTPCTICAHDELPAITRDLAAGTSYRTVAARYHVGRSTIGRHLGHAPGREGTRSLTRPQGATSAPAKVYPQQGENPTTGPAGTTARPDWQALQREAQHLQTLVTAETHPQMSMHYLRGTVALLVKLITTAAAHGGH